MRAVGVLEYVGAAGRPQPVNWQASVGSMPQHLGDRVGRE